MERRRATAMLVAFESLTKRTPSISRDALERVLEAREPLDGALHRRRRHAGDAADGRRRQHVGQQMPARQAHRRRAAASGDAVPPLTPDDVAALDRDAVGERRVEREIEAPRAAARAPARAPPDRRR